MFRAPEVRENRLRPEARGSAANRGSLSAVAVPLSNCVVRVQHVQFTGSEENHLGLRLVVQRQIKALFDSGIQDEHPDAGKSRFVAQDFHVKRTAGHLELFCKWFLHLSSNSPSNVKGMTYSS